MFHRIRQSTPFLLLGLFVLALAGAGPREVNRLASFGPTVVATIDLQRVMDSLAERAPTSRRPSRPRARRSSRSVIAGSPRSSS